MTDTGLQKRGCASGLNFSLAPENYLKIRKRSLYSWFNFGNICYSREFSYFTNEHSRYRHVLFNAELM